MAKYVPGFEPEEQAVPAQGYAPGFVPEGAQGPQTSDEAEIAQHDKLQSQYGTAGQQLLTGVEGVAKGFAGPVATGAEALLSKAGVPGLTPEDQAKREEANPATHGVSEFGGLAGGLFTGTGEAALMEHLGAAVAPKAVTALGKIGSAAVKGAVENAVFQSGDEVSKLINQDPKQSISTAIADVGLSAALGAGVGGAFGGASELWKKANGTKIGQYLSDFSGRTKQILNDGSPADTLQGELQDYHGNITSAADDVYGQNGIKAQAIRSGMPEMNEAISTQVNEHNEMLGKALTKLKDDGNYGLMRNAVDSYQEAITKPGAGSAEIFDATENLKKQLQEWGKYNKDLVPLSERNFRNTAKDLAYDLRTSLEDSKVWGKAGEAQGAINKAFSEYLPALKDFQSKFMTKVGGEFTIDPNKVNTYTNQLGKKSAEIKQDMLQNFMDASEKYRGAIEKVHGDLGIESPFGHTSTTAIKQSLKEVTPGAALADAVVKRGLKKVGGKAVGDAVGAGVGSLVGHPVIGALFGGQLLAPVFDSVLPALIKPLLSKDVSVVGAKSAADMGMATSRGYRAITRSAKSLFDAASPVAGNLSVDRSDTKRLDKMVSEYQLNPDKYSQVGGDLGHYMPDHDIALKATAANAVRYLASIKPATQKPSPLDPEMPPSDQQKAEYQRALDIAEKPLTVMKLAKEGRLTVQDVQHLKALYPELANSINEKITDAMVAHVGKGNAVPYQTRIQLSTLIGQPLDSSMSPMGILSNQQALAQNHAEQAQKQQGLAHGNKTAKMKDVNIASRMGLHQKQGD